MMIDEASFSWTLSRFTIKLQDVIRSRLPVLSSMVIHTGPDILHEKFHVQSEDDHLMFHKTFRTANIEYHQDLRNTEQFHLLL